MKKQSAFQISIPEPCHEKWEEMTSVERGRYCGSCQKVVTDFTQMEDSEIIQFIKEGRGHFGQFTTTQLNSPFIPVLKPRRFFVVPFYKKIAAILLVLMTFAQNTLAQQKKINSTHKQVIPTKKSKAPVIISGRLIDFETQKPIARMDVYLQIEGFDLQVRTTNRNGFFTFSVPANLQKGSCILSIDKTGTKYIATEEEISLEKVTENLQLFCKTQANLLKPISKVANKKNIITKTKTIAMGLHKPEFAGGEQSLYKYLANNIRYPEKAIYAGTQGTVQVTFVIRKDGSVSNVSVRRPMGWGLDQEAIRVVQSMPLWKPAKLHGKPVHYLYQLPVKFVLQ